MSQEQNGVSDANVNPGGEDNQSVSYESYQRALSQAKSAKSKERDLQEQINALRAEKDADQQAQLEEQNRFKELYEQSSLKAKEMETQLQQVVADQIRSRKRDAISAHIGAVHKPEFLQFLKLDEVDLDNPDSVVAEANRFKSEYPMVIKTSQASSHTAVPPGDALPNKTTSVKDLSDDEINRAFSTGFRNGEF